MSRRLFIDPGTRKLGYAIFTEGAKSVWLSRSSMIAAPRKKRWEKRVDFMVRAVVRVLKEKQRTSVGAVVIEMPQVFFSAKGQAANNSGSVLKIVAVVFALRQALLERGYEVRLVKVSAWKGQTPKHITAKRVQRHWGREMTAVEKVKGGDEVDACGIGDYWYRRGPGKGLKIVRNDEQTRS